jgi:hypothetical protein
MVRIAHMSRDPSVLRKVHLPLTCSVNNKLSSTKKMKRFQIAIYTHLVLFRPTWELFFSFACNIPSCYGKFSFQNHLSCIPFTDKKFLRGNIWPLPLERRRFRLLQSLLATGNGTGDLLFHQQWANNVSDWIWVTNFIIPLTTCKQCQRMDLSDWFCCSINNVQMVRMDFLFIPE